jgi:hypothetical protein
MFNLFKDVYDGKPMTAEEAREAMREPYALPFMAGLVELVRGGAWIARGLFMASLSLFGVVLQVAAWAASTRTPDPKRFAPKYVPTWYDGKAAPVNVPDDSEFFQTKSGGFPNVFDEKGLRFDGFGIETPAEQAGAAALKDNGITPEEYGEMLAHRPKLTNVVLAGMIKRHLKDGKTLKEIAVLCNVGEQYVRFFSACFTRANKKPKAYEVNF